MVNSTLELTMLQNKRKEMEKKGKKEVWDSNGELLLLQPWVVRGRIKCRIQQWKEPLRRSKIIWLSDFSRHQFPVLQNAGVGLENVISTASPSCSIWKHMGVFSIVTIIGDHYWHL